MSPNLSFQDKSKLMKKALLLIFLLFFLFPVSVKATEQEVIYPQNSNFCNEFLIEVQKSSESPQNPTSPSTEGKSQNAGLAGGNLTLDKNSFPDFEQMKNDMEKAIQFLTPQVLLENFKVEGPALETQAKHFVMGEGKDGERTAPEREKIPETKITQPQWFTQLIGTTRWLCGLFGTCPAASSPNIKVEQADVNIDYEAYQRYCLQKEPQIPETESDIKSSFPTEFKVLTLWERTTKIVEKIVNEIKQLFVKKDEKTSLANRTQGEMAGGNSFAIYSDFQKNFIPQEMMEEFELKTGSLTTKENNYTITIDGLTNTYQEPINYSNKTKEQLKRCISLCSIYPKEFDISSIDPLCSSCDISDYPLEYIQVDKTNCHPQVGGGCDYKDDSATASCEGDPVCESGKCYPNMYRMIGDYTNQGCTPPYQGNGCNVPEICQAMSFKKNSAGGFGPCQYENPNVCVRTDWIQGGVGQCDHLCNWACCAYQKN